MLHQLLYTINILAVHGNIDVPINELCIDSRLAQQGSCFIALDGSLTKGNLYIESAIANGAVAIITNSLPAQLNDAVTYIQVADTHKAAGIMAHHFYQMPSTKLQLVGITGTNGKTTVATLLYNLFTTLGYTCGLISTIQNKVGLTNIPSTHTTPDALSLQHILHTMVLAKCTYVFMECSSHAIAQQRLAGLVFKGALFTNISHDHLDYHKTFEEYIKVKKSWFDNLPNNAFAISNADDKRGAVMLQNTKAKKYYYSLRTVAPFKAKILDNSITGLHLIVNDEEVHFKLIGTFNAYNLLLVFAAAVCLGKQKHEVLLALSNLNSAEGRFDYQISATEKVMGIIDYAHTPDALLNVLTTIKNLRKGVQKIITVIGCGGDRDKAKRPLMAAVACEHSDKVIFTADNPRSESIAAILTDMEVGVNAAARRKCITIADRKEAIKTAISLANTADIVLIAGKGHEKYQEQNGVKLAFDDKKIMMEMFDLLGK